MGTRGTRWIIGVQGGYEVGMRVRGGYEGYVVGMRWVQGVQGGKKGV